MPINPNQWKKPTQQDHYTSNHIGWNKGGPQNPPAGGVGAKKPSGPKPKSPGTRGQTDAAESPIQSRIKQNMNSITSPKGTPTKPKPTASISKGVKAAIAVNARRRAASTKK